MSANTSPALERPYHHGDLRQTLLAEAERLLEQDGLQALTLRAAARAAGVTHAAPANHFGDLTGLLSELAANGYRRFGAALNAAIEAAPPEPKLRAQAMGRAYVAFAKAHPALFALMFRSERLDAQRPALRDAMAAAREALRNIAVAGLPAGARSPLAIAARSVALWSLAQGYATLLVEGRLDSTLEALPGAIDAEHLFDAVMNAVSLH